MSEPNFATAMTDLSKLTDVWDEFEKAANTATTGLLATIETARDTFTGNYEQGLGKALEASGRAAESVVSRATIGPQLAALIDQLGVAVSSGKETQDGLWEAIYDYMIANSQSVNSREFTFGSPSAGGSNVGDGTLIRLTVDEEGHELEGWWPDTYTFTCVADGRTGDRRHEELFEIEGTGAPFWGNLNRTGQGTLGTITAASARTSLRYVVNPSWNRYSGTAAVGSPAAPTALPGWTVASGGFTNLQNDLDITYRTQPGSTVSASLRLTDNETVSQDLVAVRSATFDTEAPYYVDVAVYRRDSCDGTLTITLGGVSRAVTMTTLSNNAWNRVRLVATPGQNNWFASWNSNSPTLSFQLASRTTGSLHLDDLVVTTFTRVGADEDTRRGRGAMGVYFVMLGGATPFVKGDLFTVVDSVSATRGVIQRGLALAGRGYLPHNAAGAETVADS